MYRLLQSLAAFIAVGDTGAFVKAAARLGVTPSVVSHHIARLEDELGETLVHRTTRKLSLSANGQRLYDSARMAMADLDVALERARANTEDLAGALRIALPAFVPDPALEHRIMEFARRYEHVALSLDYTDDVVDLVDGSYDLAIRLGQLPSSSLRRRQLGRVTHVLVAIPALLDAHAALNGPEDLARLPAVTMSASVVELELTQGAAVATVRLERSRIQVQSIHGAKAATLSGLAFGNLPISLVAQELASGELVRLLPGWELTPLIVQAVWPANSRRHHIADRLVQFLVAGPTHHPGG
ncbi:MAG: LysR family transcriptional regulator [Pseudomonadota bacterium]